MVLHRGSVAGCREIHTFALLPFTTFVITTARLTSFSKWHAACNTAPTTNSANEERIISRVSQGEIFMSADVMQLPSVTASEDSTNAVDDQQPFGPVICYR